MKTDSQLQHDVSTELKWEPAVQAARIGVEVKDGVLTLTGQVDSYAQKWSAERAAQRVPGVLAMTSELQVQLPGPSQRTDADIAAAVENLLEWTSPVPAGAVQVRVEGGWVTLTGTVGWQYQKRATADSIRNLMGVVGVDDQVGVQPTQPEILVQAAIEAAIERTARADARTIAVAVHGADVTLSGTARSWAGRDAATSSAWRTPGVHHVVDMITLADA
jgi:osmotically-inducible protein OsmY